MTRRGWALFVALGVIWGLPYLLIRISVREVSPGLLVFVRTAGGALLLMPFVIRRGALAPLRNHWKPLAAYSFVEIAVPWFLLFNAERHLSSSLAGLLIAAVPIVGAILARATGTDRLDSKRVAGLVLGMGGVGALAGFDVGRSSAWAAASLAVVAVGYALGPWILSRYLAELPGISVVAGSLVICALVYAPAVAFELPTRALSASVIMSMAGLTVACTAIAFVAFFALVGEVGPMRTTVITFVNPAVAVLLGVTVLDEHFGFATAIGFVLVLSGSFLATRPLRAPPAEGAPPEPELEPGAAGRAPVVAEP